MWIKLFGAAILFFVAWWSGKRLADKLRIRRESLQAFHSALVLLEGEMSYAHNSIDRAFLNISKSVQLDGFFEEISKKITKSGARTAWGEGLYLRQRELGLTDEDVRILLVLSGELGVSNTENQIKSIRYVLQMLKRAEQEAEERYNTLASLYRKLCFGAAAMILILCI